MLPNKTSIALGLSFLAPALLYSKDLKLTPDNCIIAVDLDKVILRRKKGGLLKTAIKYGGTWLKNRKTIKRRKKLNIASRTAPR